MQHCDMQIVLYWELFNWHGLSLENKSIITSAENYVL